MSTAPVEPSSVSEPPQGRRPGELGLVELLRWAWRQLTSMRTALVLLLLVALAAIPGSVIPQDGVDAFAVSQWKEQNPGLTPVYEALGMFSVYDSPWFASIYILLMISLVGCILPRMRVYWRGLCAQPPRAPRNLTRLPDHATYRSDAAPAKVAAQAATVLRARRYRVVEEAVETDRDGAPRPDGDAVVRAERGFLREAGNLVFHVAVLVVLVGFAVGNLFGYQGGVITLVGGGFSNNLNQYDDLDAGSLWSPDDLPPFAFDVESFDIDWYTSGQNFGQARGFVSHLRYTEDVFANAPEKSYDLRVNHPLSIDGTDVFLIGHGYAPRITVRDGEGDVAYSGSTVFLPTDTTFASFGVVKVPDANPTQLALEGELYPTFNELADGFPASEFGALVNPLVSLVAYTGDLGMDEGTPQSVYALDRDGLEPIMDGEQQFRMDFREEGQTIELPDGLGSVTLDGIDRWNRIQISETPGKMVTLAGVVIALIGLLGSLFIKPRRVWVRVRRGAGGESLVELAVLDRSTGAGGADAELERILKQLVPADDASPDAAREASEHEENR